MTTRADLLVSTALGQVGTTENPPGSNCTTYGEEFGVNGVAWCCIFVWWCARRAEVTFPQTAYVPSLESWARANGYAIPADQICAGDIICLDFTVPMGDGADHVEIALGTPANGRVECVGGNTSDGVNGSPSEGGGVFRNVRNVSNISTAIRLPHADDLVLPAQNTEEYEMRACRMNDNQVLLVFGDQFRVLEGDWDTKLNPALIEMGRAGLIPVDSNGSPILSPLGDNAVNHLRQVF